MAGWLPIAGGAAQSLDDVLQRMMAQTALDQRQQALTETGRHNQAEEGLTGRKLGIDEDYKNTNVAGMNEDRQSKISERESKQEAAKVTAQREQDRLQEEDSFIHTPSDDPNIQKQQDMVKLRRMSGDKGAFPYQVVTEPNGPKRAGSAGRLIRQADGSYVRVADDNTVTDVNKTDTNPDTGETTTSKLKGFTAPPSPFLLNNAGQTPGLVDKTNNFFKPILDAKTKEPLAPKETTSQIDKRDAAVSGMSVLDSLDKAIDGAAPQLGPGAGQISNFEQWVGAGDPALQRVGTLMLVAKMKTDAAIGGMRAAASPQLLARWDSILANKVTPAGLHEAVSVLREMMRDIALPPGSSRPAPAPGATAPPQTAPPVTPAKRFRYDINGNPIQ